MSQPTDVIGQGIRFQSGGAHLGNVSSLSLSSGDGVPMSHRKSAVDRQYRLGLGMIYTRRIGILGEGK